MSSAQGPPNRGPERRRMHAHWLTLLFTRYCPQCRAPVRKGTAGSVRSGSRRYCCQAHADTHAARLATARHDVQRQHAARHPGSTLLPPGADHPG
jgi:hypothetical protein